MCWLELEMSALVLFVLWSLVEVHSQTEYPYVSFMGENLPNHSYVDLTLVGIDSGVNTGDIVRCITDLSTCCTNGQGVHRGDWYFPNETRLRFSGMGDNIFESRVAQRVTLRRRNNPMSPSGIYRCDIPTFAVHDDNDLSVRATLDCMPVEVISA